MQFLKAKIHHGERTLLEDVSVYIKDVTEPFGINSWYGGFHLRDDQHIEEGGPYRISLEDGRTGDMLVTEVNYSSRSPTRVFFKGTSSLD